MAVWFALRRVWVTRYSTIQLCLDCSLVVLAGTTGGLVNRVVRVRGVSCVLVDSCLGSFLFVGWPVVADSFCWLCWAYGLLAMDVFGSAWSRRRPFCGALPTCEDFTVEAFGRSGRGGGYLYLFSRSSCCFGFWLGCSPFPQEQSLWFLGGRPGLLFRRCLIGVRTRGVFPEASPLSAGRIGPVRDWFGLLFGSSRLVF